MQTNSSYIKQTHTKPHRDPSEALKQGRQWERSQNNDKRSVLRLNASKGH